MARTQYYSSPRRNALKAVIGPRGEKVPKNFDPKKVHQGDVTLAMHLNTNKVTEEMTPAQRESVIALIHEMSDDLLRQMGVETDLGFKPGTIISVTSQEFAQQFEKYSVLACVIKDENGELLLYIESKNGQIVRARRSSTNYNFEEIETSEFGLQGFKVEILKEEIADNQVFPHEDFNLPNEIIHKLIESALEEDKTCAVLGLIKKTDNEEYLKMFVDKYANIRIEGSSGEWKYKQSIITALLKIKDQEFLKIFFKNWRSQIFDWSFMAIVESLLQNITDTETLISLVLVREQRQRREYLLLLDIFNRLEELNAVKFFQGIIEKYNSYMFKPIDRPDLYQLSKSAMERLKDSNK